MEEKGEKFGEVQLCWDECADSHDAGKTRQQGGGREGGHCAGFRRMMIRKADDVEIFKDDEDQGYHQCWPNTGDIKDVAAVASSMENATKV